MLVDARNAQRSRWPNLAERELAELSERWARERGHHAWLVFDGRALGEPPGERVLGEHLTAVGTGGELADDWIARRAAELARVGEPYWLVTSDRELLGRAGGAAERTLGGGGFLRELGAAPAPRPGRRAPRRD